MAAYLWVLELVFSWIARSPHAPVFSKEGRRHRISSILFVDVDPRQAVSGQHTLYKASIEWKLPPTCSKKKQTFNLRDDEICWSTVDDFLLVLQLHLHVLCKIATILVYSRILQQPIRMLKRPVCIYFGTLSDFSKSHILLFVFMWARWKPTTESFLQLSISFSS